jgi:hypothetical protein
MGRLVVWGFGRRRVFFGLWVGVVRDGSVYCFICVK